MSKKVIVTLKLPQLQNLIKRDPRSYREEFQQQRSHFLTELDIFRLRPTANSERFCELMSFISHVASCYADETTDLSLQMLSLMETHGSILHPDVRAKLLASLIHLRNKNMIDPLVLLKLCFQLFSISDKTLRASLTQFIFTDIKNVNTKRHDEKLNRNIQAVLFKVVSEDATIIARKSVEILSELYRRRVWVDERTVNVIGQACLNKSTKVMITALNFFLGIETQMNLDDEEEGKSIKKVEIDKHEHSKKTKKRARQVQKQHEHIAKMQRSKDTKSRESVPLFPAILLLHNPQELAESLYTKLRQSGEKFDVKLLVMNFISRLIGCHKLILLNFYSFVQKYLTSHQIEVTKILAYLIQACHDLVPPEDLMPVLKTIAYNFITERCSNEVISVGVNTVREILARVPALLLEPDMGDFIQDLAQYAHKTHKSVMTAAHGVINLVRELHPTLLKRSDRGRNHDPNAAPGDYGSAAVLSEIPGTELLAAYERGEVDLVDDELVWKHERSEEEEDEWEEVEDDEEGDEVEEDGDEAPQLVECEDGDEDEDEEGDWEDCEDDGEGEEMDEGEDEDEEENEDDAEVTQEEDVVAGARIEARRFLTSEDFELIERLRVAAAERARGSKRARDVESEAADEQQEGAVDPDSLVGGSSGRATKAQRIMRILEGRKENKFEQRTHAGGLTNTEKLRKKNYVMVRKGKRSVANKIRKSNSDQRWDRNHSKQQMGRERGKRRRT